MPKNSWMNIEDHKARLSLASLVGLKVAGATCGFRRQDRNRGNPAEDENGLLTSRQFDIDDIEPGNAFKMADVRRRDAPACGDGRSGNDAVVRSDVRAG